MRSTPNPAPFAARLALLLPALVLTQPVSAQTPVIADHDLDGVTDSRDFCPGTPPGGSVGSNGCPVFGDEDADGVLDLVDTCPLSPPGAWVDGQGCALDSDIDGIAEGLDRCPGSPIGAFVDVQGCAPGQTARQIPPHPAGRRQATTAIPVAPPGARASGSQRPVMPEFPSPPAAPLAVNPSMRVSAVADPAPRAPRALPPPAELAAREPAPPLAEPQAELDAAADVEDDDAPATQEVASLDRLELIAFDPAATEPNRRAARQIATLADDWRPQLEGDALLQLALSGHGDIRTDGLEAPRMALQRAEAVHRLLVDAGIPAHRIRMRVAGVGEPRFGGAEMSRNSRVELRPVHGPVQIVAAAPAVPAAPLAVAAPRSVAVAFAPYSSQIGPAAVAAIDRYLESQLDTLNQIPASGLRVRGYVDRAETGAPAVRLADSRAASVRAYLVSLGIPDDRVEARAGAGVSGRRAELGLRLP